MGKWIIEGRSNKKYINIFVCPLGSFLGMAYLPWVFTNENHFKDNIYIHTDTLPDGKIND